MAVGDRMRSLVLRGVFIALARGFREFQPRPTDSGVANAAGLNPIRILVMGAGVAVGYGVRTNALALGGQLAKTVAAESGRGCIVETRPLQSLSKRSIANFLATTTPADYDVVVYLPSFVDATHGVAPARWLSALRLLIERLLALGGADLTIVVTGLPLPSRNNWADRTARDHSERLNSAIAAVATESAQLRYVALPDPPHLQERRRFDPEFYRCCAERITTALVGVSSAP